MTDVYRTVKKGSVPIPGQYRVPVEMALFDPPETSAAIFGESGFAAFEYNFEHRPVASLFPKPGVYDVIFEFFQNDRRIGTACIRAEAKD